MKGFERKLDDTPPQFHLIGKDEKARQHSKSCQEQNNNKSHEVVVQQFQQLKDS